MLALLDRISRIRGVIHVGAHSAQEFEHYRGRGIANICLIEPQADVFQRLAHLSEKGAVLFNCALGSATGSLPIYRASNDGESSSLLRPKQHLAMYPTIGFEQTESVPVCRLSDLPLDFSLYDVLIMDVQGFELAVLQGAESVLSSFDYVVAEVQTEELYEGCVLFPQLTEWLATRCFELADTIWEASTWGDALFCRTDHANYARQQQMTVSSHFNLPA
jgi:FkbM family methyltransferase